MSNDSQTLRCDFCGKARDEVQKLIVANEAGICDECISLCSGILHKEKNNKVREAYGSNRALDPVKIKEHLDEFVVGQDRAKEMLAVAVTNHYKRIYYETDLEIEKSNLMVYGPTGSGKTLLARTVARYLDVPFVVADATTITEAGYVGDDVEILISRLLAAADYDIALCERGIIFIDEIDKISRKSESASLTRDVSGEGVQQALLKIIEGTKCNVKIGEGKRSEEIEVDTSNILFIAGGAFLGLEKIVERRTNGSSMGFATAKSENPTGFGSDALPMDLVQFGMIPEFVGRFPIMVPVSALTVEDLVSVLKEPKNNLIDQMKFYFSADDVELEFEDSAVVAIAEIAHSMNVGARGLRAIVEKTLSPLMFLLKKMRRSGVKKIIIDEKVVKYHTDPVLVLDQGE